MQLSAAVEVQVLDQWVWGPFEFNSSIFLPGGRNPIGGRFRETWQFFALREPGARLALAVAASASRGKIC